MKIKLEYPFNTVWSHGYTVTNGDNRKHVCLYNNHSDRTTISYARYLMSVHLGRFLHDSENVDHIDEDKTNDIVSNLQILTRSENNRKNNKSKGRLLVELECPVCMTHFVRRKGNTQLAPSQRWKVSCCSYDCRDKLNEWNVDKTRREHISRNSVVREFRSPE